MRDIKFRGFDPVNKEMRFADVYETDKMSEWITWDEPEDSPQNRGLHFEIMQFTGLQDKNGVDIYEGDIVSARVSDKCGGYVYKNLSVEYVDHMTHTGFKFYGTNRRFNPKATGSFIINNEIEVIGNIHSNPELLEK